MIPVEEGNTAFCLKCQELLAVFTAGPSWQALHSSFASRAICISSVHDYKRARGPSLFAKRRGPQSAAAATHAVF